MPKVDIIVPAFNTALYLGTAIESIMAQTFTDWQTIIIDGGSSDGTVEVAQSYLNKLGNKCCLFHQAGGGERKTSRGIAAARNIGIRNSSSEYVAFLDSDDIWLPGRLEKTIAALESNRGIGLVYGQIAIMDEQGKVFDTPKIDPNDCRGNLPRGLYVRDAQVPGITVTVRRECFDAVGLFDEALSAAEDRDMWLRVAERYNTGFVDEVLAHYRTGMNSSTSNKRPAGLYQFIQKHYRRPGYGFWARRIAIASVHHEFAQVYLKNRARGKALGACLKTFYYAPWYLRRTASLVKTIIGTK